MAGNNSSSTAFVPPFICSTPLLNPVTPNSTIAQLVTPCLANSLLPSMAAIFAFFSVIFIWFIGRSKFCGQPANKPVAKSKLVYAKLLIPLFDLAASLVELAIIFAHSSIPEGEAWAAREFHVQAISNALFSLGTILAYFECLQFGLISNGCLHLCWLFRLISILPSAILLFARNSDEFLPKILPTYLHLIFAFIIVILLFYADKLATARPENGYQRLEEEEMEFHGAKNPNPEAESSAAASLFYSYAAKMVGIGLRGTISYGQLWKLEKSNQSDVLRTRFYACHGEVRPKAEGKTTNLDILKLFFGLLSSNWEFQLSSILLILFYALCQWSNALFLRLVVEWVTAGNPIWLCAFALFCLFSMNVIGKLCEVRSDMQSFMTSYNIRSILTMIIYDKMMRLSSSAKKDYSCGEVNNLINTDVERIRMAFFQFKYIFYCLLLGTISLIGIFHEIGANALFGIGVILVMFPINFTFSWIQAKFEKIKMDLTDQRLKLCNDVLAGMKVLKLYAWEESMEKMIADIRKPEVTKICHLGILQSVETIAFHITPILSTLLSFFGYTILQRKALSPEIAFVSLLFFSMLQFCVYLLPMTVQATIKAFVSLGRVAAFLAKEEVERERIVACNHDTVENGQNEDAIEECDMSLESPKYPLKCDPCNSDPNIDEVKIKNEANIEALEIFTSITKISDNKKDYKNFEKNHQGKYHVKVGYSIEMDVIKIKNKMETEATFDNRKINKGEEIHVLKDFPVRVTIPKYWQYFELFGVEDEWKVKLINAQTTNNPKIHEIYWKDEHQGDYTRGNYCIILTEEDDIPAMEFDNHHIITSDEFEFKLTGFEKP